MQLQMVALGCAVEDVEADRYSPEECEHLARGLDTLTAALREGTHEARPPGDERPAVVDAER